MSGTITVAGSLAQKPLQGGHTWVLLQYLLGFKRLGWDVLFLDALEPEMCFDVNGKPCSLENSLNMKFLDQVMTRFGLQNSYALIYNRGEKYIGQSRQQVLKRVKRSAFILNIMGFLTDEEVLGQAQRRVFLDIDPGFGQMWEALELAQLFSGSDDHVTIGENIGQATCGIPRCGLTWITTPQPIVLEHWPAQFGTELRDMTSVISWRGAYDPIEYCGRLYGLRAHEFRKFLALPHKTSQTLQLALNIHRNDIDDLEQLKSNGWQIVDPVQVAGDPWSYRAYIQNSASELMVAKNIYVDTHSGWFSDRSICYLASGKPVLAQGTGWESRYPAGKGLLFFSNLAEAIDGIEVLRHDYDRHARAARALAETYFDSDKVLSTLLAKLGII
jgi:hypothetical protein